jgi:Leucine-rich repeat (LRR) protein
VKKFKEFFQTIGSISSLSILDLSHCKSIESLPTTLGDLKHLTQLMLRRCTNLKELPQSIGSISSLSILDLFYCKSIESLPTTIGDLKHLIKLLLQKSENLKELLQIIRSISSLPILDLYIASPYNHYQQQLALIEISQSVTILFVTTCNY